MLALALLLLVAAFAIVAVLVLQPTLVKIDPSRLGTGRAPEDSALSLAAERLSDLVDRALRRGSWSPVTALELEMAGIRSSVGNVVVTVTALAFTVFALGATLLGSVLAGGLLALIVPVAAKMVLGSRATRRRTAFADQLDATLQLLASALRAGHSLPGALATTARDSESPTSEEFGRLINETRIGSDLVDALHTMADRMANEDVHWIAEAISVQRETGGNLNEVLDRVSETLRQRAALQREVRTLSAEGRSSAVVLMLLPIAVAGTQWMLNPANAILLYTTRTGLIALAISLLMYAIAGVWMRAITRVKV